MKGLISVPGAFRPEMNSYRLMSGEKTAVLSGILEAGAAGENKNRIRNFY